MNHIRYTLLFIFSFFITNDSWSVNMTNGFNHPEAKQLLDLSVDLNGYGVKDVPLPDVSKDWELVAEGMDPTQDGSSLNGFGPFKSRWKLWKQKGSQAVYCIVIRGTIYNKRSIEEDLMTNPILAEKVIIPAGNKKSIHFRLASTSYRQLDESKNFPVPEVHAGFTYALASILFNQDHSLLKVIQAISPGSTIYITGHSQGAAIATLLHSFLHYACSDDGYKDILEQDKQNYNDCISFGLEGKSWEIKSYVFAQPKPGNWRYAMDLAQIAGNKGMFFSINNYDDPVTQVPLAIQLVTDSFTKQELDSLDKRHYFLEFLMSLAHTFRKGISNLIDEAELDKKMGGSADPVYANSDSKMKFSGGTSLNFTPSGNIIAVRARLNDNEEYKNHAPEDDFLREHHLWRYDQLSKYWPQ